MRRSVHAVVILLLSSSVLVGQGPSAPPPVQPSPAAEPLPVRRVVLYKTGVGYFEHLGTVRNDQDLTIRFTSAQLNDVLKSLTAIDLGDGRVAGISYNSVAPLDRRLGALRLPVDEHTSMVQLLTSLRGARVEVASGMMQVTGRLLTVEQRSERRGEGVTTVHAVSVLSDGGEMRTFDLTPSLRVRLLERDLRQEVGRYLDVLGTAREQDVRSLVISTRGRGDRQLFVSYVSEVPIWKSSYRLVLSPTARPLLQGWAIVDNTIGEDWRNVELSLVAGAPQSFIQEISQPYFGQRSVVPMPGNVRLDPQTHGATLRAGVGTVAGTVRDAAGAFMPGVTVEADGPSSATAVSDQNGRFAFRLPPGEYSLRASLAGFLPAQVSVAVTAGESTNIDLPMQVAALSEAVTVTSDRAGVAGGVPRGMPPPPPPPSAPIRVAEPYAKLRETQSAAGAADLGELFEYRITEPVTLQKDQSALVPIINASITAERVSLWSRSTGSGRPLRALWINNTTGLTLDGGNITIIDGGAFAGEGLVEPLKPAERRLVSYAADLNLLVSAARSGEGRRVHRIRARDGIIIQDTEERSTTTYTIRSEATTPTVVVIEHAVLPEWNLAAGQDPVESTPGAERFRVVVDPAREATLAVREIRPGTAQVRISEISGPLMAQLSAAGIPAARLEAALKPVLDKKAELAAIDRRLADLNNERNTIVTDQQRLRENMQALRGSSEERQLLQRYTRQLDQQENRLAALQQEIAAATAARTAAQSELSRVIATIAFEWDAQ